MIRDEILGGRKMNVVGYLNKMRGLMNLKRYQNLFMFKQRSVAEHSWSVSRIAHSLALIEMQQFGKEVDIATLLQKTLIHDDLEIVTGDILSGTKNRTPAMSRAVASLEKKVFSEEYANIVPEKWIENFRSFTLDAKDDSLEGRLLHASDVIDTLFEATEEIKLGNREYFVGVLQNSLEKLFKMEIDSVQYFLEEFVISLESIDLRDFDQEFIYTFEKWKNGETLNSQVEEKSEVELVEDLPLLK